MRKREGLGGETVSKRLEKGGGGWLCPLIVGMSGVELRSSVESRAPLPPSLFLA